ncbi:hypothetical protein B566_EDAN007413 [Ephemera danica]|nr:hypothetical protein B566_EDAN007413 [Ephemera danica]
MASSKATDQMKALSMLERPSEPLFVPKTDSNIVFDMPAEYLVTFMAQRFCGQADGYRELATSLKTRFNTGDTMKVQVRKISLPDISDLLKLPRNSNFSTFIPFHQRLATRLIDIFLGMRTLEDFFSAAAFTRDRVNPTLFVYSFSVAILHRPDTRDISLPPFSEIFPDKFVDRVVFDKAREQANILIDEDLGINSHHWHWHLVYPFSGPREIVSNDRRGELFYYMHQQLIARYDFERMCNGMARTKRLTNLNEPIEEGYFPKLDSRVASRDINRPADQLKFDLDEMVRWRDRIYTAIERGMVELRDGSTIPLDENRGIDIVGNMVEASILSPNRDFYGDFHNMGHVAMGLCHDPDQRHLETFGVVGDVATAMRDPIFYRWHSGINDICMAHKHKLPQYSVSQLEYRGIRISSIEVVTPNAERNTLSTFWQKNDVNLSRGMDFAPRGSVYARFTHLQHATYQYRINVENNTGGTRMATVRIFMAPKFDERNQPWIFAEQKGMFIEMDRFVVTLRGSPRMTTITRNSSQSTVTIPFERTFRDLETNRPQNSAALAQFNFCGCGWPQHMLVPKGNSDGMPCQLFVMLTDYTEDRVNQGVHEKDACADAASFCGIRDQVYPDKRAMGFPFDRLPRAGVTTLQQFLTPNMGIVDVNIRFTNRVYPTRNSDNALFTLGD